MKKEFGDASFTKQPTGGIEGAEIRYEIAEGMEYISVDEQTGEITIIKPGEAKIKAIASKEGYEDVTANYEIRIAKKLVSISLPAKTTLTHTGEALDVPYEIEGAVTDKAIEKSDILFTYTNLHDPEDHDHKNIGDYYVTASVPVTHEYYMTDRDATGMLTITAKIAVIKPDANQYKQPGQYDPEFTYTVSGMDEGDVIAGELSRKPGEAPGEYAFDISTLHCDQYEFVLDKKSPKFIICEEPVYSVSNCKLEASGSKIKVTWNKVPGVDGYVIFAGYCGSNKMKPIDSVSAKHSSYTIRKIGGRKIDQRKCVKVKVEAYKLKKNKKKMYKRSLTVHLPGKQSARYTSARTITISSSKTVKLNVGKTSKIKAVTERMKSRKQLIPSRHCETYRYATTAEYIAKVNKKGVIKAVGPGRCEIIVYAQNGISAKVTVIVR